ncbi:MAG: hypothetical protein LBH89_02935 [Lactococcus lactis]|jgi:Cft2 family RNA processing exonuclease|nr:hypothetical protein [Lactococcus lactis]
MKLLIHKDSFEVDENGILIIDGVYGNSMFLDWNEWEILTNFIESVKNNLDI